MSKVIQATCAGGAVLADGLPLPSAEILSEGVGSSEGIAVLDDTSAWYVANIMPDLKTTLEKVIDSLAQVKTALDQTATALSDTAAAFTIIDVKPVGGAGSAPAPGVSSQITSITSASTSITTASTQVDTLKTQLNTLKGALR